MAARTWAENQCCVHRVAVVLCLQSRSCTACTRSNLMFISYLRTVTVLSVNRCWCNLHALFLHTWTDICVCVVGHSYFWLEKTQIFAKIHLRRIVHVPDAFHRRFHQELTSRQWFRATCPSATLHGRVVIKTVEKPAKRNRSWHLSYQDAGYSFRPLAESHHWETLYDSRQREQPGKSQKTRFFLLRRS